MRACRAIFWTLLFLFPDECLGIGAEDVVLTGQQQGKRFAKEACRRLLSVLRLLQLQNGEVRKAERMGLLTALFSWGYQDTRHACGPPTGGSACSEWLSARLGVKAREARAGGSPGEGRMTLRSPAPGAGRTQRLPSSFQATGNTAGPAATKDTRAAPSPLGLSDRREGAGPGPREGSLVHPRELGKGKHLVGRREEMSPAQGQQRTEGHWWGQAQEGPSVLSLVSLWCCMAPSQTGLQLVGTTSSWSFPQQEGPPFWNLRNQSEEEASLLPSSQCKSHRGPTGLRACP